MEKIMDELNTELIDNESVKDTVLEPNNKKLNPEVIVAVFDVTMKSLLEHGYTKEESLSGLLSQIAVQLPRSALEQALEINKKFYNAHQQIDNTIKS